MNSIRSRVFAILCGFLVARGQAAEILQTFFVPFPEDAMQVSLNVIDAFRGYVGNEMRSAISIVASMDGTIIYYDHWEDGYEDDITSPTQSTTLVWGDANALNGIPPGFTQDVINAGTLVNLESTMDVTRNVINIEYDGHDKIAASGPISITRGLYAIEPGEVLAEACQVFDVGLHGRKYRAPVGVGTGEGAGTNSMFSYSAFYIMADFDNTFVEVDRDNDGVFEEGRFLDAGESWVVNGGVVAGATVQGSKAFQCHLVTGDIGSTYEMRWYELWPEHQWGTDYFCPVGTRIDVVGATTNIHPAVVFCFNPGTNPITIFYETRASTGSFVVAANSVSRQFEMPLNSGGRFYTTNGAPFLGSVAFDTWYNGAVMYGYTQHCQRYDWGMGLVPRDTLTTMGICSWGPGHGTTGVGTNGNPVWVMAVSNTTIYVDFDSDPSTGPLIDPLGNRYNFSTNVGYLEFVRIFDYTDNDQTGLRLYTLDGTLLTSGWGEDPDAAEPGNPYLDMGFGILPFPTVLARKYAWLLLDNNSNGYPDPGDQLEFLIDVINVGFAVASHVVFRDDLPTNVTAYVPNSSYLNGMPVPDDLPPRPTRFPFDGQGYDIGTISLGATSTVRYLTEILVTLPSNFLGYIHNNAIVSSSNGNWQSGNYTNILLSGLSLTKEADPPDELGPGETVTYTLRLINTGQFTYTGVQIQDLVPIGASYVSNTVWITAPGGVTNTVWDRFDTPTFTNNNGSLLWLNAWQEVGEGDGPAGGRIRVTPDTNLTMETFALVVCGSNAAVWRSANLRGHSAAVLSFKYRRDSLPDANRFVDVFVSTNNWASSNFLLRIQGPGTDTNFVTTNREISAWISTNTSIRFVSSSAPNMGLTNRVWFDDIMIRAIGSNITFAGNPPPILAENLSLPPGTSIVARLTLRVNDPPVSTQIVNTARARAQQHEGWVIASATNPIRATIGVVVSKGSPYSAPVTPGTLIEYKISVENTGDVVQTGVRLTDWLPLGVTYVAGSATVTRDFLHTNFIADAFHQRTYTNNTGNVDWAGPWVETGDDTYPTSGYVIVAVDNDVFPGRTYALRMSGPTRSVTRTANLLSGYTNAWLRFEYRRDGLDIDTDSLTVQVSSNGGLTWSPALVTLTGPVTDVQYHFTNINITAYISSNTTIRFLTSGTLANDDYFWLDNVQIAYSGSSATSPLRPPPELMDGTYYIPSRGRLDVRVRVIVDDPPTATQMVNTVCYQSDQQLDCQLASVTNVQNFTSGMTLSKTSSLAGGNWGLFYTNTYTITLVNTGQLMQTGIIVTDALPPGVTYVTGSTVIVAPSVRVTNVITNVTTNVFYETVSDQFNVVAYTNNNGTTNWLSNWVEVGDDGSPASGSVLIQTDIAPTSSLRWTGNQAGGDYVTRSVALPALPGRVYTNVTLFFAYRRVNWDANDTFTITVSTNNFVGQSNQVWSILGPAITDPGYIPVVTNITPFIGTNLALRLRAGGNFNAGDVFMFDYVTVAYSGYDLLTNFTTNVFWASATNAGGTPPNLASGYFLPTGQSMTITFRATANAPSTFTQYVNQAYAQSTQGVWLTAAATDRATRVAIGDFVWLDANTNGIQDVNEVGIGSVTVRLYHVPMAGAPILLATTNTSSAGYYLFSGWPAGTYALQFVLPFGYVFTTNNAGSNPALDSDADPVTGFTPSTNLVSGTNLTIDAGMYVPPASIGDWIWLDANNNGVQNPGEVGVTGVVVRLYNGSSNLIAVTTNDASGYYEFSNLPAGYYFVEFVIPTQYIFTLADQGGDDDFDSDANPVTGRTAIFYLGVGQKDTSRDAGVLLLPKTSLQIRKTSDLSGCGAPSSTVTYTIVVLNTNINDETAYNVVVHDPAPYGITWLTNTIYIQAPSAGYTGVPPVLAYGYTLQVGEAMTVTVRGVISQPTVSSQLVNIASTYASGRPVVYASVTNCLQHADLGIVKTATDKEVNEVQIIEYAVTVTNRGPHAATGVRVTDILPSTLQYNSHSNGVYSRYSGVWTIGTLPAFSSTTLYINVTIREGTAGSTITNLACITWSDHFDPTADWCATNTLRVTAVVLARFEGRINNGQFVLEWETASEIGTAGFYLYRREPGSPDAVLVSEDLVPAVLGAPQGGIYRLADPSALPGRTYDYELEEVEADGTRLRYGPFRVYVPASSRTRHVSGGQPVFESAPRSSDDREARRARAVPVPSGTIRSPRNLDEWPNLRLAVSREGIVWVTAEELASAAGRSEEEVRQAIDEGRIRLSRQGFLWAWKAGANSDGIFFFAAAFESPFTSQDVYKVEWKPGPQMTIADAGAPEPKSDRRVFASTAKAERDISPITFYAESVRDDYWVWASLPAPRSTNLPIVVPWPAAPILPRGVASSPYRARLIVRVWGATSSGRTNEHTVTVSLNGQRLTTEVWSGLGRRDIEAEFDAILLREGTNIVTISATRAAGVPYSTILVDELVLEYARRYRAWDGVFSAPASAGDSLTVRSLKSRDVVVLAVDDPAAPVWIENLEPMAEDDEEYLVSFDMPLESGRCWVAEPSGWVRPDVVRRDRGSTWSDESHRGEYVVIAPADWADTAERLAAHRRAQGLSAVVVPVEDLYDEFTDGRVEPVAIREFLFRALGTWEQPPRYVLLAGLGTEDYKNYTGVADNIVPIMLLRQPYGLFVSDAWFADFDDNGVPEMAVGRLPVIHEIELAEVVDKIIRAESAEGGLWRQRILLASDRPDNGGEFEYSNLRVAARLPRDYVTATVNVSALGVPAARLAFRQRVSEGAAFVNFFGHAGLDRIAADPKTGQAMLDNAGVALLNNPDKLPFIVSLSCTLGRFSLPNYDCLGTVLLLQTNAGAVAVWAPAGQSYNQPARVLADGLYRALFRERAVRVGDAILRSLSRYVELQEMPGLQQTYNLLGDPAMPLVGSAFLDQPATLSRWKEVFFTDAEREDPDIGDDGADPDGDGLPNLAEYALGWNPWVADGGFEVAAVPPDLPGDVLVIEFQRRKGVGDVRFGLDATESLQPPNWFDGSEYVVEETVTDDGNGLTETVRWFIHAPEPIPRLYFRVLLGQ